MHFESSQLRDCTGFGVIGQQPICTQQTSEKNRLGLSRTEILHELANHRISTLSDRKTPHS